MHTSKSGWTISAVLVLALSTAACDGQPLDRAGGTATTDARTLTFAISGDAPDQPQLALADLVDDLSDGSLTIAFENMGESTYETGTIDDVREGVVDLATVGTRVFDRVGVDSFQALMAPMLIDSHPLQGKVFDEGLPDEMLDGLEEIDLVGIGVAPGPLRKVLGVEEALVSPQDYAGKVVGMQDSDVAAATLEALGALPRKAPPGASLDGLDGYEQQLTSIFANHYERHAGFVTANVTLWPRPFVMIMNRAEFDSLSTDQQQALRTAFEETMTTLESSTTDDVAVRALCDSGMQFATASDSDITDLEAAVLPVYDELMTEPQTASYIDTIRMLKSELGAPPDSPSCDDPAPAEETPAGAVIPEGTYTTTLDNSDWASWEEGGPTGEWSLTIADGVMQGFDPNGEPGLSATFTVFRDRVEVTSPEVTFTMTWAVTGDELRFGEFDFGSCSDCDPYEIVFGSHPYTLEDGG